MKRSYSLFAPAKINLYLEILGDRSDGFHELIMVMQSVTLGDRLTLTLNGSQNHGLTCDSTEIPIDPTNLAYRAADLMTQRFPAEAGRHGGVDIHIEKRIPVGAGLAGGSSNAAAVIVGLDLLWELGLTQPELQEIGAVLGSDIPFCISGGTALATGRGEVIDPLPDLDHLYVVLAKYRSLSVYTPWAYQTYRQQFGATYLPTLDQHDRKQAVHAGPMMSAIAHRDTDAIAHLLHNDLEKVVLPAHPQVTNLRSVMARSGSLGTMMSGSGPTVFALFSTVENAEMAKSQIATELNDPDLALWVARFSHTGIQLHE